MADRIVLDRVEEKPQPEEVPKQANGQEPEGQVTTSQFIEISTPTARTLLKFNDHFPFDLWPDILIIDEIKVSLVRVRPLGSGVVESMLIKDINNVVISTNPIWATITVAGGDRKAGPAAEIKEIGKVPMIMKFMNKDEAREVRRVLLGLIIMNDRKVNTSKMAVEEIRRSAEELGRARK